MKRLLCLLLSVCLLLSLAACGKEKEEKAYVPTGDALLGENEEPEVTMPDDPELQELTLAYSPRWSMNPLEADNLNNRVLFSLIFQGLFSSDANCNTTPILCSGYRVSSDRKTYTFLVDSAARFSDGTRLTANDVLATYEMARSSSWYGGRFTHIMDMQLNGDNGVTFYLDTPYENLAILLDIPILKAGEVTDDHPIGSGPYRFEYLEEGGAQLVRVADWWCGKVSFFTNAQTVTLVDGVTQSEIRDEFQFEGLALSAANPMTDSYADYRCDYELWNTDNGVMIYLGINTLYSDWFKNDKTYTLRKALTKAINREYINETFYNGKCSPSALPTSPLSIYYSQTLASQYTYDPLGFVDQVAGAPVPRDKNNQVKKLKLLVNSDDSARLRTARYLAEELTDLGIPTGVLEYGGSGKYTFEDVLRAGTYDIYLGETRLPPNYDLSEFFRSGGRMSWGGIVDGDIMSMMREALADRGNYYNLNKLVAEDGKIIPILFGTTMIYANRGQLLDLAPSRDNVFYYTLGKTMEGIKQKAD